MHNARPTQLYGESIVWLLCLYVERVRLLDHKLLSMTLNTLEVSSSINEYIHLILFDLPNNDS